MARLVAPKAPWRDAALAAALTAAAAGVWWLGLCWHAGATRRGGGGGAMEAGTAFLPSSTGGALARVSQARWPNT
jgi:hypothetical protein